jgi:hypothetical protein
MPKPTKPPRRPRLDLHESLFDAEEEDEVGGADKETPSGPLNRDPDKVKLRNVVDYDTLEHANPDLLRRLLLRYKAHLASKGLNLDDFSPDHAWLDRLFNVLQRVDLDPELQQAFLDIAALASAEGHEHVLRTAHRVQLELFERDAHLPTIDAALKLYLEHPFLFKSSQTSLQVTQAKDFVVFCARNTSPMTDYNREGRRITRLRKILSAFFTQKNYTGYCDIRVTENEEDIGFIIIHGRYPKTYGVILDQNTRSRTSNVQEAQDVVLFHKATCRLSVHAVQASLRDAYRALFGFIFFRSREHFMIQTVVTAEPLLTLGAEALSTAGFPSIRRVALRNISVNENDGHGTEWELKGPDVKNKLHTPNAQEMLHCGPVKFVRLDMRLEGQSRAVVVKLTPPYHCNFDRRVGADQVRAFLIHHGFLLLTPAKTATPSAGVH